MNQKNLIVAATYSEVAPIIEQNVQATPNEHLYQIWDNTHILITGVGQVNTVYALMHYFMQYGVPSNLINLGICGSYSDQFPPGTLVRVSEEIAANELIEHDGRWQTWADIGLVHQPELIIKPTEPEWANRPDLVKVRGITVDFLTDDRTFIQKRKTFFQPKIETMEGAAIFKVANRKNIHALQIRCVSNYVENRDKKEWAIKDAIEQLHIFTAQNLKQLIAK